MNQALTTLADSIAARFGGQVLRVESRCGELTFEVAPAALRAVCGVLRDDPEYRFEQLIDLCGVDYSLYGQDEWNTDTATFRGFSRPWPSPRPSPAKRERVPERRVRADASRWSITCCR